MQPLRIGLVSLARTTFDIPLAKQVDETVRQQFHQHALATCGPSGLITDQAGIQQAINELAGAELDLLVILQATFADATMVVELSDHLGTPLFLWAVPESPSGGRLRLNSFCGINLAGHSLSLRKRKYSYAYAAPDDPQVLERIQALASAGRVFRRLRTARLGVVGHNPDGFEPCRLDLPMLEAHFGLEVEQVPLQDLFERARKIETSRISVIRSRLDRKLDNLDSLEQEPLSGTLRVYAALKDLAAEQRLDGLAVRCWPEFFTEMGCAACGAMSMVTDEQTPCSCEADANGTVTQLILQWLSGEPAFGTDMVSLDFENNSVVIWHCGLAPLSMADPSYQPQGTIHSNRQKPLLMEFPLKPGIVTIARLGQTADGPRLVVGRGEMLSAPPSFSGTSGVLRFERPARSVFETIMSQGLEHHISLTYGDYVPALLALADLLDLPVLLI
jgi:L-fucose isomerase-like protein